jgi:hypothetical protein
VHLGEFAGGSTSLELLHRFPGHVLAASHIHGLQPTALSKSPSRNGRYASALAEGVHALNFRNPAFTFHVLTLQCRNPNLGDQVESKPPKFESKTPLQGEKRQEKPAERNQTASKRKQNPVLARFTLSIVESNAFFLSLASLMRATTLSAAYGSHTAYVFFAPFEQGRADHVEMFHWHPTGDKSGA